MRGFSQSDDWRRILCSLIVLLFAWQVAVPMATAGQTACTMQCCLRAHSKGHPCDHGSKSSNGPAFTNSGCGSGDCLAVSPAFVPLAVAARASFIGSQSAALRIRTAETFSHVTAPAFSNSFQRPPPAV